MSRTTPPRPNILILMADQVNGTLFPDGPAEFLDVPALRRLAERSLRFGTAYTPSPLCAPGRSAFMTGRLPSSTGVYDNAAEFPAAIPTFVHHLRRAGYQTCLSGKMHFVGPDQLHGFEERLTTDVYPADFGWTPDWTKPDGRIDWWYHNLGSVTTAGVAEITNQLEYDDEVAFLARHKLYDLARSNDDRPWCLTVSFTHPHDPYVARREYWDRYTDCDALDPRVPELPDDQLDPHSRRLLRSFDRDKFDITPEDVRRARQGYFASTSYVDDQIGQILDLVDTLGWGDDTVVLFCSDHGDVLGEKGLWFKMSFAEGSARVPLMLSVPPAVREVAPALVEAPVSLLDVVPTLLDLLELDPRVPYEGSSLLRTAEERTRPPVPMEYFAEGSVAPMVAVRAGNLKYTDGTADPAQLFDLSTDPDERHDLVDDPAYADRVAQFAGWVSRRWDLRRLDADIRDSQAQRLLVWDATRSGTRYPWDHQPLRAASERYMRNHMDLNVVERDRRFPRVVGD